MKINSIILGAYYSCQANNYADMKVCINTYFVNTNRNISLYFPEKGCHLGTNRSDNET